MSRPRRHRRPWDVIHRPIAWVLHALSQAIDRWRRRVPVEILITDRSRRRALEGDLRAGLRRLQRIVGDDSLADVAVVVQHVIRTDRQLAGCYQVGQRPDGSRFAFIRLALQVNGRRVGTDELLAALAEQCIGLLTQASEGTSLVVPVELEVEPSTSTHRLTALPPDPLLPHTNGSSERVA